MISRGTAATWTRDLAVRTTGLDVRLVRPGRSGSAARARPGSGPWRRFVGSVAGARGRGAGPGPRRPRGRPGARHAREAERRLTVGAARTASGTAPDWTTSAPTVHLHGDRRQRLGSSSIAVSIVSIVRRRPVQRVVRHSQLRLDLPVHEARAAGRERVEDRDHPPERPRPLRDVARRRSQSRRSV